VGFAALAVAIAGAWSLRPSRPVSAAGPEETKGAPSPAKATPARPGVVVLTKDQQAAIGLEVQPAVEALLPIVLTAPGRVAPDESHFAYITPRAPGIVRSVAAQIGQRVKKGDVLATIDSEVVGQARLGLITSQQELEVAGAQARWGQMVHQNTLDLLTALEKSATPDEIHKQFQGRPVGDNREQLITAYARYRKAQAALDRVRSLQATEAISVAVFQEALAEQEAAQATYQSLLDEMRFTSQLTLTRALQAQRQAETAVRIAWERLRILGADTPALADLVARDARSVAETEDLAAAPRSVPPVPPVRPEGLDARGIAEAVMPGPGRLASTYELVAPFDGTVLDREVVVPGIAVDTTHRLFTLANLATVWIEVNVYETGLAQLLSSGNAEVRIVSPAYPGRVFKGEVLYTGDMVNEKTISIRLLARAENPDSALKPGMFVQTELVRQPRTPSVRIPASAVLTEGEAAFVYVRTGPEEFERRAVQVRPSDGGFVAATAGLKPGEAVVTKEAFKLKSEAARVAASES
jgi:Cu(I)/Ag(I) efflux system membrane fusion protein